MSDKTITLTVSAQMFAAIERDAARTGMSMSSTVERRLSLAAFAPPFNAAETVKKHLQQIGGGQTDAAEQYRACANGQHQLSANG